MSSEEHVSDRPPSASGRTRRLGISAAVPAAVTSGLVPVAIWGDFSTEAVGVAFGVLGVLWGVVFAAWL